MPFVVRPGPGIYYPQKSISFQRSTFACHRNEPNPPTRNHHIFRTFAFSVVFNFGNMLTMGNVKQKLILWPFRGVHSHRSPRHPWWSPFWLWWMSKMAQRMRIQNSFLASDLEYRWTMECSKNDICAKSRKMYASAECVIDSYDISTAAVNHFLFHRMNSKA